jgi:hypothetical protein
MTAIQKHMYKNFAYPVIGAGLALLLAACGSSPLQVPVESRQAPGAAAVGSGPLWTRQLIAGNFQCELGNRVEVRLDDGQRSIRLGWKGRTYAMQPVGTSTGALRFEDRSSGLVWIQIPSKSFLLNSRIGQQLANECKVS